jgi:peptidoglycan/LPS O-acetylase OafA/YrhL
MSGSDRAGSIPNQNLPAAGFLSSVVSARLEGLRGMAALTVALSHSCFILRTGSGALLSILGNGRAAVSLFFVLSGFVLGASLRREKKVARGFVLNYAWRRIRRIYPAFAVAVIVSWLLLVIFPTSWNQRGAELVGIIQPDTSFAELGKNLIFAKWSLDNVTWSLRTELIGSMFLIVCLVAERRKGPWLSILSGSLMACAFARPNSLTIATLIPFLAGYCLQLLIRRCGRFRDANLAWRVLIIFAGFLLVAGPRILWFQELFDSLGESIGGALLIFAANVFVDPEKKHSTIPVMIEAGRLSYSFYLYHPIVLFWAVAISSLYGMGAFFEHASRADAVLVWLVTSTPAAVIAHFSYKMIEEPLMVRPKRHQIPKTAAPTG